MTSRYAGGLKSWGTCTAMSRVRPDRIWRQAFWGANPISSITRSTRWRVSSATSGLLLMIRDTVATETPLAAAMSMIVVLGTFDLGATRRDPPTCAEAVPRKVDGRPPKPRSQLHRHPCSSVAKPPRPDERIAGRRVEPPVEDDDHVTLRGHARILADPLPDRQAARRLVPGKLHRRELTGLVAIAVAGVLVEVEVRVATGVHVDLEQPVGRLVRMRAVRPHRHDGPCLLYTSPSPRDRTRSRMPSSA